MKKNTFILSAVAVKIISLVSLGFLLSACAVGNEYDYKNQPLNFSLESKQKVAVAVVDQRPYIVSGNKTPDFVGLQRGGFNNPFDVTTLSDEPLSDSISSAIVAGLKNKNIDATVLKTEPSADFAATLNSLNTSDFTRLLLINLSKWKSDTLMRVWFDYDVGAVVTDSGKEVLAKKSLAKRYVLRGEVGHGPYFAIANVPIAYKKVIEELLNDPAIVKALK